MWEFLSNPTTVTVLMMLGSALVGVMIGRLTKKLDSKDTERQTRKKQAAERYDPDANVLRDSSRCWIVNPCWIYEDAKGDLRIRTWEHLTLTEESFDGESEPRDGPLDPYTVSRAVERGEWMTFEEHEYDQLWVHDPRPRSADEAHLFQPLDASRIPAMQRRRSRALSLTEDE